MINKSSLDQILCQLMVLDIMSKDLWSSLGKGLSYLVDLFAKINQILFQNYGISCIVLIITGNVSQRSQKLTQNIRYNTFEDSKIQTIFSLEMPLCTNGLTHDKAEEEYKYHFKLLLHIKHIDQIFETF